MVGGGGVGWVGGERDVKENTSPSQLIKQLVRSSAKLNSKGFLMQVS